MARWLKVVCVCVALLSAGLLLNTALECTKRNTQLYKDVETVAVACCESTQCNSRIAESLPQVRVECILNNLDVLLRNECTLRPYCHNNPHRDYQHAILCDIETCLDQGPRRCTWILALYIPVLVACVYVMTMC